MRDLYLFPSRDLYDIYFSLAPHKRLWSLVARIARLAISCAWRPAHDSLAYHIAVYVICRPPLIVQSFNIANVCTSHTFGPYISEVFPKSGTSLTSFALPVLEPMVVLSHARSSLCRQR